MKVNCGEIMRLLFRSILRELASLRLELSLVSLVEKPNVSHERIVRIRVGQQAADGKEE